MNESTLRPAQAVASGDQFPAATIDKAAAHGIDLTRLRGVRAFRIVCCGCGKFVCWCPTWDTDVVGKGYQCPRCGLTSIRYLERRLIGPRSKEWGLALEDIKLAVEVYSDSEFEDYLWDEVKEGLILAA